MNASTGDYIAIAAVSLNALVYLSGVVRLNETVRVLNVLMTKFESTLAALAIRQQATELSVGVLQNNCRIYHENERG
jgi:hypothetical protein